MLKTVEASQDLDSTEVGAPGTGDVQVVGPGFTPTEVFVSPDEAKAAQAARERAQHDANLGTFAVYREVNPPPDLVAFRRRISLS